MKSVMKRAITKKSELACIPGISFKVGVVTHDSHGRVRCEGGPVLYKKCT